MRADRLLSILMLLQARGKMTAQELAGQLEVSERTIYRDVEALCVSGVPIYTERGPGGGFALLDRYRTNLTGMKEEELRALLMLDVPAPIKTLGIGQDLQSALLKLSASLPASSRMQQGWVQQRLYLDWSWWFQEEGPAPFLLTLQQAVWEDRQMRISYHSHLGIDVSEVQVAPYGLVSKAGAWFLVAAREGGMRVFPIIELVDVQETGQTFQRRPDFNLALFWQNNCLQSEQARRSYLARVRVSPEMVSYLPWFFGHSVREWMERAEPPDERGWRTLTMPFKSLEDARGRLLSLGCGVEVLEPEALRCSLGDYAQQIVKLYSKG